MSEKTPTDLNTEYKLGLSPDQIGEFARLGGDEAVARLRAIGGWLSRVNVQNHDGVTVTPALSGIPRRCPGHPRGDTPPGRAEVGDEAWEVRSW